MRAIHLFPVLLILVACRATLTLAQIEEELPQPEEKDNLFPVDTPPEDDVIQGSGAGVSKEPLDTTTSLPELGDIEPAAETTPNPSDQPLCPDVCACSVEEDGFAVDCADKGLTELPQDIDTKTTKLNLQNNGLTVIPKSISALKSLRELNANGNSIAELAPGSVSELPELKTLKLANNRLLEYPQELKNGFSLTQLEEIDLSRNDIRDTLAVENFSNFKSLRTLTLPTSAQHVTNLLCEAFNDTLETVCIGSCDEHTHNCLNEAQNVGDEYLTAKLPGVIAFSNIDDDNIDSDLNTETTVAGSTTVQAESDLPVTSESPITDLSSNGAVTSTVGDEILPQAGDFSLRTAVNKEKTIAESGIAMSNAIVDIPNVPSETPTQTDTKVEATTSETKTGGVDKSVIAMVVAGMVLVVAGITIKKNWTSLRKRFSSNPRPAAGGNTNGGLPEEMPLQDKDKSPV